jgi:hypothetical protein
MISLTRRIPSVGTWRRAFYEITKISPDHEFDCIVHTGYDLKGEAKLARGLQGTPLTRKDIAKVEAFLAKANAA